MRSFIVSQPEGIISVRARCLKSAEADGLDTLIIAVNSVPCLTDVGLSVFPSGPIYLTFRLMPEELAATASPGSALETVFTLT